MTELSQFFLEIAKNELREDENRRQQSLKQFREWIKKHQFIKIHDLDDIELLRYLRGKKFSMDAAYECFERATIFYKSHPEWYKVDEKEINLFAEYFNKKALISLNQRDGDGRKYFFVDSKKIEELNRNIDDELKVSLNFLRFLMLEEETQIAGINIIINATGISFDFIKKYTSHRINDLFSMINIFPARIKNIYIIGLPSIATKFFNLLRKLLSVKLQNRFNLMDSLKDLHKFIDTSMILDENFDFIEDNVFSNYSLILKSTKFYDKIDIDFEKIQKHEIVGSFLKLEID